MEAKEILEWNKLIAEFMGFPTKQERLLFGGGFVTEDRRLEYHSSWDWLMSVVEKIESLGYKITIEGFCCVIYKQYGEPVVYCSNFDTKINATYHAVMAFVNWYYRIK